MITGGASGCSQLVVDSIDYLVINDPTPLVSVLFGSLIHTFSSIFVVIFILVFVIWEISQYIIFSMLLARSCFPALSAQTTMGSVICMQHVARKLFLNF